VSATIDTSRLTLGTRRFEDDWPFEGYPRLNHLSPSSLKLLVECPREWQQRYLHDRPERPAEALVVGSAFHAAMERNMSQKISSGVDLPVAELIEWYDDEGFSQVLDRDEEKSGLSIIWDSSHDDAKTRGRLMVGEYHNQVSPRLQPTAVEGTFSVPMGLPVPIQGRYDLLTADRAIDWKTAKKKTTTPKTDWLIQAVVYGFATGLPVEFHTASCSPGTHSTNIVTPLESEALYVNLSQAEIDALQTTVVAIGNEAVDLMRRYGPDAPWPTRGRFHMFACDYCSFRDDCPAWAGEL